MNPAHTPRILSILAVSALLAAVPTQLSAQATLTWDGSTDTTWSQPDTTSWTGNTYNSGDNVQFLGSGGTVTISGTVTPGSVLVNSASNYTFAGSPIGGSGTLTKSGTASLTLNALNNSYSGGTIINAGSISTAPSGNATDTPFGTGSITVNTGATLALNRTYVGNTVTLNGGTVTSGNSFNSTLAGNVTLTGNSTINVTGNLTIAGNMSGTGGFTKTGGAFVPLNGTNTYDGATIINAGGLTIKSSLYGNVTSKWNPANITVASGAALVMSVGGPGEFTIAQAGTMFSQLGGVVNNNGLRAGSQFGVDTRTAGGTFTIADNLIDSSGTGGGSVGFRYVGNGAVGGSTLELTGNNTYSGVTIVDRNGTIKVSSLNSVSAPMASSSLGRPTTVANGTIHLGSNASFQGGGLIYTGTGETTDRVINLGGANGTIYRFDQSGTGLLKFTSGFTITDNRGAKTIVLQGSTSGTGEIAGTIPFGQSSANPNHLTKSGTGTWTLSGTNLYDGVTTINANGGMLKFAKQVSLYNNNPALWTNTKIIVNSGGVLGLNVGGAGEFTTGDVTTLLTNLTTGINNNGLRSGSAIAFDTTNAAGGTFTVANNIANSAGTGGGAIGLTKLGTNTLNLTGNNTYSGTTTVSGGTLAVNNATGSGTGSGAVLVQNGGTLGGAGFITTSGLTVQSGGTLAPGNSPGNLTVTGPVVLSPGSLFGVEVNIGGAATVGNGTIGTDLLTVNGSLNVSGALLTGTYGGNLGNLFTGNLSADNMTWIVNNDLLDTITGTFANTSPSPGLSGLFGVPPNTAHFGNVGGQPVAVFYNSQFGLANAGGLTGGNDILLIAIPEPSRALLGLLALLPLALRRRR